MLIVDNFGLKHVRKADGELLQNVLQQSYTVTTDWTGSKFAGINIQWDYSLQPPEQLWMDTSKTFEQGSTILIPKN